IGASCVGQDSNPDGQDRNPDLRQDQCLSSESNRNLLLFREMCLPSYTSKAFFWSAVFGTALDVWIVAAPTQNIQSGAEHRTPKIQRSKAVPNTALQKYPVSGPPSTKAAPRPE